MKKLFITLCGIAVLSGLSNIAFAEGMGCPNKFSPEMKAKMEQRKAEFDKRLNLTPEQKEKMKAIHQESRAKIKPLFECMKNEREKLLQIQSSSTATQQDIQAQREKITHIKSEIKAIRKMNFEKTQAILNPEQQKEFKKMREEHKNKMKEEGKNHKWDKDNPGEKN